MGCLISKTNVVTPASKDVIERQRNNDRSSPKLENDNMVDLRSESQQHFYVRTITVTLVITKQSSY